MKKIMAVAMALVLMLGMAVQAFGAITSTSKDVYLSVNRSGEIVDSGERNNDVLGFEISWTAENITVSVTEKIEQGKKWNPDTKSYEWDESTRKESYTGYSQPYGATVTNISAVPVTLSATFEYAEGIEYQGFVDLYVAGNKTLAACDEQGLNGGTANINFVIMAGEESAAKEIAELVGENESIKLGSIVISISAAE